MKTFNTAMSISAALLAATVASVAGASSHREAPIVTKDPAIDNTDVYAWVTPGTHDKLTVLVNYNPFEEPSQGPNFYSFSDQALYEIHFTRGNESLDDVVKYQIRFHTKKAPRVDPADLDAPLGGGKEFFSQISGESMHYTVTRVEGGTATVVADDVPVAPWNIGPRTNAVVYKTANYDDAFVAAGYIKPTSEGGKVFAGPRDDGFYVDTGAVFDLANLRPSGQARDGVAGFNVLSIALEIPTASMTGTGNPPTPGASDAQTLGVWASASRKKVRVLHSNGSQESFGAWQQVSRLAIPLVNEALIGLQDKDKYNRTQPADDVANFGAYFLNPVLVRDAAAVGILKDPTPVQSGRTDILDAINLKASGHDIPLSATGDVLRLDLGLDSQFPNGRMIPGGAANAEQVDVTDVILSLVLTKAPTGVADGVNHNDKAFLSTFPYLALPWESYANTHGAIAP